MVGSKDNQDPYDDEHREEDHDGDDHDDGDHDLNITSSQDTDQTVDERTSLREWTQFVRGSYPRTLGSSSSSSSSASSSSRGSASRPGPKSAKKEKKKKNDDPSRVPRRPGLTPELKGMVDRLGADAGRGSSNSNTTSDPDSDSEMEMAMNIETWQKAHPDTVRRIRRFYCLNGWVPVPMTGTRGESSGSGRLGEEEVDEDEKDEENEEDAKDDRGDDDDRVHDDDDDDDETSSTHSTRSTRSDTSDTEMIEQIVLEYALKGPEQRKNIQASVDLAVDFFPGSLGVFRLGVGGSAASGSGATGEDDDDVQPVGEVVSGPDEMIRIWNEVKVDLDGGVGGLGGCRFRRSRQGQDKREARHRDHEARQGDTSDDAEAVLEAGPRRETFIPGLRSDWRFSHHPFVRKAKVDSYISRSIELELDREALPSHDLPSIPASEKVVRLVVGTLDFYCTHAMDTTLSPAQERVLSRITLMLQTQLKATWEGRRRSREARANTAISGFIDDALASHDPTRLVASVQKS